MAPEVYEDGFDEPGERPEGSCENCDCDIYEEDDSFDGLCSCCAWLAAGCPEPPHDGE